MVSAVATATAAARHQRRGLRGGSGSSSITTYDTRSKDMPRIVPHYTS
jgi:hypothetical protein